MGALLAGLLLVSAAGSARGAVPTTGAWSLLRGQDGRVTVLYGARSTGSSGTAQEVAASFLRRNAELLGLPNAPGSLVPEGDVVSSPAGTRVRFRQYAGRQPVFGAQVTVLVKPAGQVVWVESSCRSGVSELSPLLTATDAQKTAALDPLLGGVESLLGEPALVSYPSGTGGRPAWEMMMRGRRGRCVGYLVDARTGKLLRRRPLAFSAANQGYVYLANPKVSPVRARVGLEDLDRPDVLRSPFVDILYRGGMGLRGPVGEHVKPTALGDFLLAPGSGRLGQTTAYYQIRRAYQFFRRLGFNPPDPMLPVFLRYRPHENEPFLEAAYADEGFGPNGALLVGEGAAGQDLALDGDVLIHEYAHFVVGKVAGFSSLRNSVEGDGLSEGLADYFACTLQGDPYVGEFGAEAFEMGACIRSAANRNHYPESCALEEPELRESVLVPWAEGHRLGEIWAAALWDLRKALGAEVTDRLVFDSLYRLSSASDFRTALVAILESDAGLYAGSHAEAIRGVFGNRGISESMVPRYLSGDAFGDSVLLSPFSEMGLVVDGLPLFVLPVDTVGIYLLGRTYKLEGAIYTGSGIDRAAVYLADNQGTPVEGARMEQDVTGPTIEDPFLGTGNTFSLSLRVPAALPEGYYRLGVAGLRQGRQVVDAQARIQVTRDSGPTPVLNPEPPAPAYALFGDLDADGKVTVADAQQALVVAAGLVPDTRDLVPALDFQPSIREGGVGDGRVDMREVAAVLRAALGLGSLPGAVSGPPPSSRGPRL